MNKLFRVVGYIKNDHSFLLKDLLIRCSRFFSDEKYLRIKYKLYFGKKLDLESPQTFNEKLQWLKVNYHNPLLTLLADKYWAKQYVAAKIGEEYVVPCYGHWSCVDDIKFEELPSRFFLKANQDSSGGMLVDKDKGIDIKAIKKKFSKKHFKKNWYWHGREWAYKHIEPCILAEEYLDEGTGHELQDYKFWCFNGVPTYMYITNKGKIIKENFYDMDFTPVDINHGFERTKPEFTKPVNFEKMKELASILSKDIPFVRVDFFNVKGKLYFGECTFYDWGGIRPFSTMKTDIELGHLLVLPPK